MATGAKVQASLIGCIRIGNMPQQAHCTSLVHMYLCVSVYVHVHTYVCVRTCTYVHICILIAVLPMCYKAFSGNSTLHQ